MPKTVSVPLILALIGAVVFALLKRQEAPSEQYIINVAISIFNFAAIMAIFIVLYRGEKLEDKEFGARVRENISTIIVSMLISVIGAAAAVLRLFA